MRRVLITRPIDDAVPLTASLKARSVEALVEPMMTIRSTEEPLPDLDGVQGLLFTSANGVRGFMTRTDRRDFTAYAVGEATGEAARRAGFTKVEVAGGDVVTLAALVIAQCKPDAGKLIHVAGTHVAGNLSEQLTIAGFVVVPLTLLLGAHLWQILPVGSRMRLAAWRLPIIGCLGLPAGAFASLVVAPHFERLLFGGDLRGWLDGRGGSGLGGWVLAFLPITAIVAAVLCSRLVNPWLRSVSVGWTPRRAGLVSLGVFVVGVALTVTLAVAAGTFLDAIRLDARGGLLGSYVQRNAMIVAFGMSFAVIPLIFTIADDALSSVPDHLRSASLGAGATPWQTAIRVMLPAAASGLFSAVMIGLGRAVGETMIVLMAAGNTPIMDWSLFSGFQTLSAAIATELPEAARGSAHYRVLFLAALTLFGLTFILNTVAEIIRERFRRRSHEL